MADTIIEYVDLASDVVSYVSSTDVDYNNLTLKPKIFDSPRNSFLKVTKKIGSKVTIMDVVLIDDNFITRAISG